MKTANSVPLEAAEELSGSRILIVDDDAINRELLSGICKNEGYRPQEAKDGQEALHMIQSNAPDLVLLDVMMPVMDGLTLCRLLEENHLAEEIPVILITSLTSMEDETKGLLAGAVDFIKKPSSTDIIKARIRTHLLLKKNRDMLVSQARELKIANIALEHRIKDHKLSEIELKKAKDEIEVSNMVKEGLIKDLFEAMCEMLSNRDMYTFEHGMRVAAISIRIGERLGLTIQKLNSLELGCLVHDISKVAIPDDVLLKPGTLDEQDRHIMELHPEMGARLFAKRPTDPLIIDIIHKHHERIDGSGYPQGLSGEEISLPVRIASVADTYEALIAKRPYKKSMPREKALVILRQEAEQGRLDSSIVDVLEEVTESWDPLLIGSSHSNEYTKELDMFRKKIYFKEPLSDFYNYRYLFFLADTNLLGERENGYSLFKLQFDNLDDINVHEGYLKTDNIIDEIGANLQHCIEEPNEYSQTSGNNILFRKGATYIVYSNCTSESIGHLHSSMVEYLDRTEVDWGLSAELIQLDFDENVPMDQAVYRLLDAKK